MEHVMMDLETWGTTQGCAIRSIGAALFDLDEGVGETFYRNIQDRSCWLAGLRVEASTADWWSKQTKDAKDRLTRDQLPLKEVVRDFHNWFRDNGARFVWCQGGRLR